VAAAKEEARSTRQKFKALQQSVAVNEQIKFKQKAQLLEKNLEQIQQMYQELNVRK
jgi:uncharacterized SAM-dependent methyltransferase